MNTNISRHLRISGKVQGVAYRFHAVREAERLGLRGWVRNLANGDVEAIACGPADAVEAFVTWARRGSPAAEVSTVLVKDAEIPAENGFVQRPDV